MDTLYSFDLWLFQFGNQTVSNPVFDVFFPTITSQNVIVPLYCLGLAILAWKGGVQARIMIVMMVIGVILTDQSLIYVKEFFQRVRPCHTLNDVRLLVNCGSGLSFPSAHAANNAGAGLLIGYFYPRQRYYWLLWASLIAYSRVYCGVHYPSDIIGGMIYGIVISGVLIVLWNYTIKPRIASLKAQSQKFPKETN